MGERLGMGRALNGALPGLLPVWHGPCVQPRLCAVMRQQLRMGLASLRNPCLQHLDKLSVIVPPYTSRQGLIGRLLDENMLKGIPRLWWHSPLIDQLSVDELYQRFL